MIEVAGIVIRDGAPPGAAEPTPDREEVRILDHAGVAIGWLSRVEVIGDNLMFTGWVDSDDDGPLSDRLHDGAPVAAEFGDEARLSSIALLDEPRTMSTMWAVRPRSAGETT